MSYQANYEVYNMDQKLIETEYTTYLSILNRFDDRITQEIQFLLNKNKINLAFSIQHRIKSLSSIINKLNDNPKLNIKSIIKLQDLIGIRLITNFYRDIENIIKIIESNFKVYNKYNIVDRYSEREFGYSSIHLIIGIPDAWLSLPSVGDLKDILCEIQIRTLAQHLWANASHLLQYKNEKSIPINLLRDVNRISALLELIDLEYERILTKKNDLSNTLIIDEDPINVDNLRTILNSSLPQANQDDKERYSDIVNELAFFKILTISKLKDLINENLDIVLKKEHHIVDSFSKGDEIGYILNIERQDRGVFFTHTGLVREMMSEKYGSAWSDYKKKSLTNHNIKNKP